MTSESFCLNFPVLSYLWKNHREKSDSGIDKLSFTYAELSLTAQDIQHLRKYKPRFIDDINKYYFQFGLIMILKNETIDILELGMGMSTL